MAYADQFAILALLFGVGMWAATRFYMVKGASLTNVVLLALLLAGVAPFVGGIPSIGGGAGVDLVSLGAILLIVLWAAQTLFRVSLAQAAAYIALAWVVGAALLRAI
jgi:hypothetical protein